MSPGGSGAAIEIGGVFKTFGATKAVDDVSFAVTAGTVHALLGENGAGKSTTMKLLSGLIEPDSGTIRIEGRAVRLRSPRDAHRIGIQTAFQELTLIPDLTVLENMLIPYAPIGFAGTVRKAAAARDVTRHFEAVGLDVDLYDLASDLDLGIRQKVEIARALYRKPRILLLDEPTSALAEGDVVWLGEMIAEVKARGTTVLFITHRMQEVRKFCDRLTILRNGRHIVTTDVNAISDDEIVEKIIGRSISQTYPPRPVGGAASRAAPVLELRRLCAGPKLRNVDLELRPGEIHGIAALQGMGQVSLFMACFGATPILSGELLVDGRAVHLSSPADALHPSIGIGLLPAERKTQGLFLNLDGATNASLPVISRFSHLGLLNVAAEQQAARTAFAAVEVSDRALYTRAGAFSGGNQQKIAVAKWIMAESRILLLFDPTRGIDVGTKSQLYALIRDFADAGGAILFHSTEIPELVHLCDRVSVLYEGALVASVAGDEIDEVAVMRAALGGQGAQAASAREIGYAQ
jgi:ribose transport system ATP-binding protein